MKYMKLIIDKLPCDSLTSCLLTIAQNLKESGRYWHCTVECPVQLLVLLNGPFKRMLGFSTEKMSSYCQSSEVIFSATASATTTTAFVPFLMPYVCGLINICQVAKHFFSVKAATQVGR